MKIKPKGRIGEIMEMQDKIAKAVEEGLLGEEVAENMTPQQMEEYLGKAEVKANAKVN
jgi:hypothetical protein